MNKSILINISPYINAILEKTINKMSKKYILGFEYDIAENFPMAVSEFWSEGVSWRAKRAENCWHPPAGGVLTINLQTYEQRADVCVSSSSMNVQALKPWMIAVFYTFSRTTPMIWDFSFVILKLQCF